MNLKKRSTIEIRISGNYKVADQIIPRDPSNNSGAEESSNSYVNLKTEKTIVLVTVRDRGMLQYVS